MYNLNIQVNNVDLCVKFSIQFFTVSIVSQNVAELLNLASKMFLVLVFSNKKKRKRRMSNKPDVNFILRLGGGGGLMLTLNARRTNFQ